MPLLNYSPEALAALAHFRDHDVTRATAHERALDAIADGTGRSRAVWVASRGVYLTGVPIIGRGKEDLVVWLLDDAGEAVILHIGRAEL